MIRHIVLLLYSPLYYSVILIKHLLFPCRKTFRYKVSLCLIFRDEGHYLKEWLDYHILIGIDHFYLYNNFSKDNYKEILNPYIKKGIVTLIEFPYEYAQAKAYQDCYEKAKDESEWLGYIDTDEYINLQKHDNISDFLKQYHLYPSLYLNWLIFGTSGHIRENYDQLTIERYTQCWNYLTATGKSFIHNTFNNFSISIHFHKCTFLGIPLYSITPIKSVCINMHSAITRGIDKIGFINHYWSRSYEFYIYKDFEKGDVASASNIVAKQRKGRFEMHELKNSTKNFSIQRWLLMMKKKSSSETTA